MLQPFHYEVFIGNYVALLALVLTFVTFRRGLGMEKSLLSRRTFIWLCVLSVVCGALEVRLNNRRYRDSNLARDAFMPVTKRLNELTVTRANDVDEREVLFSPDIFNVADNTAGFAPQALLWATHAALSPTLSEQERQERFFQHLYYSEVAPEELKRRLGEGHFSEICALYGYGRHVRNLTAHFNPVSATEIEEKVCQYKEFIAAFDYRRASHPKLSWVVIPEKLELDFSNLDRWYLLETEERVSSYRLFRLKLREPVAEKQITQAK